MADQVVRLILRARDEATREIRSVSGELGVLDRAVGKLSGAFGIGGIAVGASFAGATAIFAMAKQHADALKEAAAMGSTMGETREEFARQTAAAKELNYQLALLKKNFGDVSHSDWAVGLTAGTAAFANALSNLKALDVALLIAKAAIEPGRAGADFLALTKMGEGVLWKKEDVPPELSDERKNRIKEIVKLLGVGGDLAKVFADALDRIDNNKKADEMRSQLFDAGAYNRFLPMTELNFLREWAAMPGSSQKIFRRGTFDTEVQGFQKSKFDFMAHNRDVQQMLATMSKVSPVMAAVQASWKNLVHNLRTDSAQLVSSGLMDVVRAWDLGSAGAADRIRQTFRQLFADIANAAIDQGLGLILSAISIGMGGPVGKFIGLVGGQLTGHTTPPPPPSNVINHIHTYDTQSMYQSLTTGDLAKAMRRRALLRRAGSN